MLSVTKLRVGAEAYQLTGVAQSLDDYYSGSGEAEGWWTGEGAKALGLEGTVDGDDLRAVLAGLRPRGAGLTPNGETLHPHPRRVPGFDLTFKAPKSVSVLYAVSDDPRVQGAIIEACENAVRDTIAWLERDVMAVRRGTGNERYLADLAKTDSGAAAAARIRTVKGADVAAAVFRHRTSRAGDPLLHWHVLLPNLVQGGDQRWSAFFSPHLFRNGKAAGEVFQAALRQELTQRLGVEWRPGRHVPELSGVPQNACDAFSKRAKEVDAWLETHGRANDPASRQEAVLATRRGKAELEGERFDACWKLEGARHGFGPEQAEALVFGTRPTPDQRQGSAPWRLPEMSSKDDGTPYVHDRIVPEEEWIADLLRNDLCIADATFTRPELIAAVARRLGEGATVETIDAIAARVMASPQVLPIHTSGERAPIERWTSTEMAATERRLLGIFEQRDTRRPVPGEVLAAVLDQHTALGPDQADAVATLATSADPVSVMIGPAGTGKTYTLAVARAAYEMGGLRVIGAAPSARAAAELEGGAGIESFTLHALRRRWDDGRERPGASTVLVIDEAAMASTRDLEPLISQVVGAGGRAVLVGDNHQLPEVTAGGALSAAAGTVGSVAELTVNRRQHEPWERAALAELRKESVPAAVDAYRAHGRLTIVDDGIDPVGIAADRYLAALDRGQRPILMAGTNDMVQRLNWAVRDRLIARGAVIEPGSSAEAGAFGVGEQVVLRRNARVSQPDGRTTTVRNSDAARVLAIGDDGGLVVRRESDHTVIRLDAQYVTEHVDHGYAVTAHRAQGGTWDLAIAVGADGLYREAAYVQMSRGRASNELIIPAPQMEQLDRDLARHDRGIPLPTEEPPEAIDDLLDRLERSRAKHMALSRDPDADIVSHLASTATLTELEHRAVQCRTAERAATLHIGIDPDVLAAAVERAQRTAHHVQLGQQVKAFDRQNIGTVVGFDDTAGTVTIHFRSRHGHEAIRELPWTEVDIVERHLPPARVLPAVAQVTLDHLVSSCGRTIGDWHQHLAVDGIEAGEAQRHERAAALLIDRSAALLAARSPEWLTDLIGSRPPGAHDARVWDHAVRTITEHRASVGLDDSEPGLGPVPVEPAALARWHGASRHVLEARAHLDAAGTHPELGPWPLLPSRSQLEARLTELDERFETAPADQRDLIARLRDGDQLTLADTTEALNAALEAQCSRRDWILANWPHVVEYAEITRAIETRTYGPELDDLRTNLKLTSTSKPLHDAVDGGEQWVDRALCSLAGRTATTVNRDVRQTMEDLADYRARWGIESADPIGGVPRAAAQVAHLRAVVGDLPDLDRSGPPAQGIEELGHRPVADASDVGIGLG